MAEGHFVSPLLASTKIEWLLDRCDPGWARRQWSVGPRLQAAIGQTLGDGGQVILLLNRRGFAHYLALALEFQLAADILSTAVAPSWDRIGKLAAIAVIRTVLNYFLTREMAQERSHARPAPGD